MATNSISVDLPFLISNKTPLDAKQNFATKSEMKDFDTMLLSDTAMCTCDEDGKLYVYNINNTEDGETGKWRVIEGEGGSATIDELPSEDVNYTNLTLDSVTNVKECLDTIIAKLYYVAPSITSFTCNPSRTAYEIGEKITSITFTWAYNKEIVSQSLTGCTIELSDRTVTYSTELTSNKTFTLTASDGTNNATSSKSFTFNNKVHHGSASIPTSYDSTFILSLSGALKGNKNGTYTTNVGAGQYFYIAMPTSFNNSDVLTGTIGGFSTDFSKVATIEHTNASGYKTNYNIYKSTNSNLGNITMTI